MHSESEFAIGVARAASTRKVRELTLNLRTSREPYWKCLRKRLTADHSIDAGQCILFSIDVDQGGDSGWLATTDSYLWVDFTFQFGADSHVDHAAGRFYGWDDADLSGSAEFVAVVDEVAFGLDF